MTIFNHKKIYPSLKDPALQVSCGYLQLQGRQPRTTTGNNNRQPSGDLLGKVAMIKTRKNEMVMI